VFQNQNQNFSTALGNAPTTLYIAPAALDPMYLLPVAIQQLRPGMTDSGKRFLEHHPDWR
jgi:hypothetical protein